jgi:hypothetical protein
MSQRLTVYTALPDQSYDPRVTDLTRPLRVPGTGIGGPDSGPNGYPIHGTTDATTAIQSSTGGLASASDVAGAQAVVILDNFKNRNETKTYPIQLVANQPIRITPGNLRRTGIVIQNKDPAAALFFAFGNAVTTDALSLVAGGMIGFDFTTPPEDLWLLSASNIQVAIMEMTRKPS